MGSQDTFHMQKPKQELQLCPQLSVVNKILQWTVKSPTIA